MTTNIGSSIIQENFGRLNDQNESEILEDTKEKVFELLKRSVRPEFLNRIDENIMFKPLSKADVRKIVDIQFKHIQKMLEEKEHLVTGKPEITNLSMSTYERAEVYNEVMGLLKDDIDHREIARQVVVLLNQFINDKMDKARKRSEGKSPIFRRVDD